MVAGKNVILVIFDTLRRDCVGIYGAPPWGKVKTPHLDALASESEVFTRAYPESLPTLPVRRTVYTGHRTYPFHNADLSVKGENSNRFGWGPILEEQDTIAEILRERGGYRTALIADVPHMFKPSMNFSRGFDQWTFLRGQERDSHRSGPGISKEELDRWIPREVIRELQQPATRQSTLAFIEHCLRNMHGRSHEEDYFNAPCDDRSFPMAGGEPRCRPFLLMRGEL